MNQENSNVKERGYFSKQSEVLGIRIRHTDMEIIREAAKKDMRTVTDFVRNAALAKSRKMVGLDTIE